jgi:4-hydroxybenzoate polyprenyltransferase
VKLPTPDTLAELVRLPAVLTVPGDILVGAAAAGRKHDLWRSARLAGASSCLYLAGMALNDFADREVDARERPTRPIPSGRVTPGVALGLAVGLTASGAAIAVTADGRRGLPLVLSLAAAVWSYDLVLKNTAAGPAGMSACRTLDVLLGAGVRGVPSALPAAAVVGAHTAIVTTLSRREVAGGTKRLATVAPAATTALAATAGIVSRATGSTIRRVTALGLLGAYAAVVGSGYAGACRDPTPKRMQRAVRTGILGLMLLESGILAGAGELAPALGVAALWPTARSLSGRQSIT